jgi:hypothetical protein
MAESRKRKPKRRNVRQQLAAIDGEVIKLRACCGLRLHVGVQRVEARHDDNCPALRPASPRFLTARSQANRAIAEALAARGLGPVMAVMLDVHR